MISRCEIIHWSTTPVILASADDHSSSACAWEWDSPWESDLISLISLFIVLLDPPMLTNPGLLPSSVKLLNAAFVASFDINELIVTADKRLFDHISSKTQLGLTSPYSLSSDTQTTKLLVENKHECKDTTVSVVAVLFW